MQSLYRGKTHEGKWVYGYYFEDLDGDSFICPSCNKMLISSMLYEVLPQSVGQCTGEVDKKGNRIFAGDIFIGGTSYENPNDEYEWTFEEPGIVSFEKGCFYPLHLNRRWRCDLEIEIIGNTTDTPELSK